MGDANTGVVDSGEQVIVLAFDLLDAEVENLPGQLVEALSSPAVQAAIKKTLIDFANSKTKPGAEPVTGADAAKLMESLRTGVTDAATKKLGETIKATPEYKALEASLENFQKAAKSSALGVWVDKNKKILYVVGAVLVVGAATTLYVTRTGGAILDAGLDPLKNKTFEVLQVGQLTIKAGLWDFKPDARVLGARIEGTANWKSVKLELKFGILAVDAKVQQIEGSAVVKSGAWSLDATGKGNLEKNTVNLGLSVGYNPGKFNLKVGAVYEDSAVSGTASLGYKTKIGTIGAQASVGEKKGVSGLATLTIDF